MLLSLRELIYIESWKKNEWRKGKKQIFDCKNSEL